MRYWEKQSTEIEIWQWLPGKMRKVLYFFSCQKCPISFMKVYLSVIMFKFILNSRSWTYDTWIHTDGVSSMANNNLLWASLIAQLIKNLPSMQETWVPFLGWEDPLEKEMATHSSILAWKIPWTEEPGGLQSMGLQRVRRSWTSAQAACWWYRNSTLLGSHTHSCSGMGRTRKTISME